MAVFKVFYLCDDRWELFKAQLLELLGHDFKLTKMRKAIASRWQTVGWGCTWVLTHRKELIRYVTWAHSTLPASDMFKAEWEKVGEWLKDDHACFSIAFIADVCDAFLHLEFAWSQKKSWRHPERAKAGHRQLELALQVMRRWHIVSLATVHFSAQLSAHLAREELPNWPEGSPLYGKFPWSDEFLAEVQGETVPEGTPISRFEQCLRSREAFFRGIWQDVLMEEYVRDNFTLPRMLLLITTVAADQRDVAAESDLLPHNIARALAAFLLIPHGEIQFDQVTAWQLGDDPDGTNIGATKDLHYTPEQEAMPVDGDGDGQQPAARLRLAGIRLDMVKWLVGLAGGRDAALKSLADSAAWKEVKQSAFWLEVVGVASNTLAFTETGSPEMWQIWSPYLAQPIHQQIVEGFMGLQSRLFQTNQGERTINALVTHYANKWQPINNSGMSPVLRTNNTCAVKEGEEKPPLPNPGCSYKGRAAIGRLLLDQAKHYHADEREDLMEHDGDTELPLTIVKEQAKEVNAQWEAAPRRKRQPLSLAPVVVKHVSRESGRAKPGEADLVCVLCERDRGGEMVMCPGPCSVAVCVDCLPAEPNKDVKGDVRFDWQCGWLRGVEKTSDGTLFYGHCCVSAIVTTKRSKGVAGGGSGSKRRQLTFNGVKAVDMSSPQLFKALIILGDVLGLALVDPEWERPGLSQVYKKFKRKRCFFELLVDTKGSRSTRLRAAYTAEIAKAAGTGEPDEEAEAALEALDEAGASDVSVGSTSDEDANDAGMAMAEDD